MRGQNRLPSMANAAKFKFRVAMRIRIMFLDLQVAFVVEKAVKHESRIAVGAFDGHAVEGSVIVREEGIEFESKVAKACATGLLCHLNGLALLAHLNCAASN
jgi:hypothetical protein